MSPFADLRKNVVLREARIFNDRELNPAKCAQVLTKLLYLISQGEHLSSEEATEVFFAVTKLFQSADPHLRRLIYLMIKELKVESDSSLIVVSCLTGDHRVLTNRGWRSISTVRRGDVVLSLNTVQTKKNKQGKQEHTWAMEWKPVIDIKNRTISESKDSDRLYRLLGSGMDVIATKDHRMLVARLDARSGLQATPTEYSTVGKLLPPALTYALSSTSKTGNFNQCQVQAVVCSGANTQPDIKIVIDGLDKV